MKLCTVVVYDLKMCRKEFHPKIFQGDHPRETVISAG